MNNKIVKNIVLILIILTILNLMFKTYNLIQGELGVKEFIKLGIVVISLILLWSIIQENNSKNKL